MPSASRCRRAWMPSCLPRWARLESSVTWTSSARLPSAAHCSNLQRGPRASSLPSSGPASGDATLLTEMGEAGEFGDVDVFGPLALDCALLESAARAKGIEHPVAGHADCMVVPNIEAGNLLGKSVKYLGGSQCAHVVAGAKVPILIPSRVESVDDKVNSIALGVLFAGR